jgi:ParB family chromosome partitioning protein
MERKTGVRKVLGRGLSALVPEDLGGPGTAAAVTTATVSGGENLREIDVDLIDTNAQQPRTRFTEQALEELSQSIKEHGVIQPLVVREKGSRYELIAGERRWRATQRAGLRKVPVVIRDVPDEKVLEWALIENIQREDLNSIEEGKAYRKLIDKFGFTQEALAARVGKDRTLIANHMRLLRLPEDIQKLVEENKLSAGHARALLSLEDATEQRRLARSIIDKGLSVREAEKAAKRAQAGSDRAKPVGRQPDPNVKAAEVRLQRRFGTKVKIVPNLRAKGGRIEIEYYGEADLDRIYRLMLGDAQTAEQSGGVS